LPLPLAYVLNNRSLPILTFVVFSTWFGGVFFAEMALWLLSLFGSFGDIHSYHRSTAAELWAFNLLWAGMNALLLWLGGRFRRCTLRGYAITFLIIQGYTEYF